MRTCFQVVRLLLVTLWIASSAFGQNVITVDANQGTGSDFADLPAAVAAAAGGDVLLVRPGTYTELVIDGKGLMVVAEGPTRPNILGASIRNLSADQDVVLVGLEISSPTGAGLLIEGVHGPILIEDCSIFGAGGHHSQPLQEAGHPGVLINESFGVTLSSSHVQGGNGANFGSASLLTTGRGGEGCLLMGPARMAAFGSVVIGGNGGDSKPDEAIWGGDGAPAIRCASTNLDLVGCTLIGGSGGDGGEDLGAPPGSPICGYGGDAGNGVSSSNGGPISLGSVRSSDTQVTVGSQGIGGFGCSPGAPGINYEVPPGQPQDLGIELIDMATNSPIKEADAIVLSIKAPAGSALFLGVSTSIAYQFNAPLNGVAMINFATTQIIPLGIVNSTGFRNLTLGNPMNVPQGRALRLLIQAAALSPTTLTFSLGEPASFVFLDK